MTGDPNSRSPAPGARGTNPQERRAHRREKTLRLGSILFNEERSSMRCFIMDVSEGGAHLRLQDLSLHCPDRFVLRSDVTGRKHRCVVAWRRGTDVGVRWLDEPPPRKGAHDVP